MDTNAPETQPLGGAHRTLTTLREIRRDRFADKKDVSGRIGETSRFIAFGLVALVFTVHAAANDLSASILLHNKTLLNIAGLFGTLSILCDYLQYLCGYFSVNRALSREQSSYSYDDTGIAYKGRSIFFWLKQVFSLLGAVCLIWLFSIQIF